MVRKLDSVFRRIERKSAGFTLIELLVVVAIISILGAMLLPALSRAREKARQAVCMGNLKQLAIATFTYCDDYNGWLPPGGTTTSYTVPYWNDYIASNFGMCDRNFRYRFGTAMYTYFNNVPTRYKRQTIFLCPSDRIASGGCGSYAMNIMIGYPYWTSYPQRCANMRLSKVPHPDITALIVCSGLGTPWIQYLTPSSRRDLVKDLHGNGTNMLFCDGHVEWISIDMSRLIQYESWSTVYGYVFDRRIRVFPISPSTYEPRM